VADFGIAAALEDRDGTRLTAAGDTLGTPAYMAPEQALGSLLAGPGIDLYAVGVLLYRMLSGRLPFTGATTRILYSKVTDDPPLVRDRNGDVLEPDLQAAVMLLLDRRPEVRYSAAADVIADLRPFASEPFVDAERWAEAGGPLDAPEVPEAPPSSPPPAIVGRDRELARMEIVAEQVEAGVGRLIVLRGALGVGKSSLLEGFAVSLAEAGRFGILRVAHRRAASAEEGQRAAIDRILGTAGRGEEELRTRAREFLRRLGEAALDDLDPLVQFMRGDPERSDAGGSALRDHNNALFVRLLRHMAVERPVLVTIDDVSAGGPDSAAFLEYFLFEAGFEPAPILIVATATDDDDERFAAALARSDRYENRTRVTLTVGPLDPTVLGEALAVQENVPLEVARAAALRAGGNPLYALHLVRARGADAMTTTPSSRSRSVPDSLRAIVERGLRDRLANAPDAARLQDLLVHAAVLGVSVPVDLLVAFVGRDATAVDDDVDALIGMGVLTDSPLRGEDVVVFTHSLLRDTLLEGLAPRRSRKLNLRAAELRRARIDEGGTFEAGAIGDHLHAAGRTSEAADAWLGAVDSAFAAGAPAGAVRWGLAALEVLEAHDPRRDSTAVRMGRVLADTGDLAGAEELLLSVVEGGDADLMFVAGDALGELYENQGSGGPWTALMDTMAAAEATAGPVGRRALARARTLWLNVQGRPQEARKHGEAALAEAPPGEERQRAAQRLAFSLMLSGELDAGVEAARTALAESGGRVDLELRSLRTLVNSLMAAGGQADEAVRLATEVLERSRRIGATTRVPIALLDLGLAKRDAGDAAGARRHLCEAARVGRDLGFGGAALQAQFHLLLQDLMEGKVDGVVETMGHLSRLAAKAEFAFVLEAEKPFAAWAAALGGKYDRARALLSDAGDLSHLPKLPAVGHTAEGLAAAFSHGVTIGREDLRPEALRLWGVALGVWTACRRPEYAERCRVALADLQP
jgi:tetratricopeptide (TPR) repeat protein